MGSLLNRITFEDGARVITMTSKSKKDAGKYLLKTELKIKAWDNFSNKSGEPLINPKYLEEIKQILEDVITHFNRITLPCFPQKFRLMTHDVLWSQCRISDYKNKLNFAVERLTNQWEDVLAEAKKRLENKFSEEQYPQKDFLANQYDIELETEHNPVSTTELLGKYSVFHRKPSICEAIEYGKKLQQEMKKSPEKRKLPDWPY